MVSTPPGQDPPLHSSDSREFTGSSDNQDRAAAEGVNDAYAFEFGVVVSGVEFGGWGWRVRRLGFGFGVLGLGFGVWGLGFGTWGLGLGFGI